MAEIVPNRVPCGKKPTPTPPQPEPTPVTLCDITGIKYFKLQSQIPGDYTKNCGLLGNEIDENFYFLRSMDIKTGYTVVENDRKYLVLERVNCGREIKIDITDEDVYDHGFRVDDGYIYVKYPDGHEDPIRDGEGNPVRFLVEGDNVRVVTDASIDGDGSFKNPIGIDLAYRTGTYAPADFFADLTCPEETINQFENIGNGHAIITRENASRFGKLYTFRQAKALNKTLLAKYGEKGWRVPSKEDWAQLLNWAESKPSECENCGELPENFNHDTDKSGNFGCNAGARLKTTVLWATSAKNTDDFGFSIYPVGVCPEDYNTAEPNQFGFTGLYKVASFWTSSEKDGEGYVRTFSYGHDDVAQYTESPVKRLSIRLVRNVGEDFDVKEYEEILGKYVPVVLTTDGKQLWTLFNIDFESNYDGYNANEVTIPDAWKEINTGIPVLKFFKLNLDECKYEPIDEYDIPSSYQPVFVDEVPTETFTDSPLYIYTEEILNLDMTTESKFYYNAWDGKRWHKKMMLEGESVVIVGEDAETSCDTAATPYVTSANTNHEWRVYVNPQTGLDELIDTAEAIKDEMRYEFKKIWEHISGLTENLESLSGTVADIYDEMQSGFTSAFTAISDLQDELDVVEASVGLSGDGTFIVIRESGITASAETIADAIGLLDDALVETIENLDILSGVVEDIAEKVDSLQEEVDNIEDGVGLSSAGTYEMKTDTHYLNSATTVEGEIAELDEVAFSAMTEIEELQKKTIEPLDDSITVVVSGYSTLIGVNIDPDEEHLKIGDGTDQDGDGVPELGLWFDGDFGEKLRYPSGTTYAGELIGDGDIYPYVGW